MSFTEGILFRIVEMFLGFQKDVELKGPLFLNRLEDRSLILKALVFRSEQNLKRAPWLESPEQHEIENSLNIDQRSAHFIALKNNEVLISLRLTPGPFELSAVAPEIAFREQTHASYWEFGRLCTSLSLRNKGFLARFLLIRAGLWLFSQTDAKGIVAICQENKQRYMSKFALYKEGDSFMIPSRNARYCFISAPREKIISRFTREFLGMGQEEQIDNQNVS